MNELDSGWEHQHLLCTIADALVQAIGVGECKQCGGPVRPSSVRVTADGQVRWDWPSYCSDLCRYGESAHVSANRRAAVYERDGHRCRSCGAAEGLTIDHIVPRSRGGLNGMENLQTLCRPCNSRKGARV